MPRKLRPKRATTPPDSPMAEAPTDTSAVASIMEAIKASERSVLTKIEDTVSALATDLHTKIESLSDELRQEINTVRSEAREALETANQELKIHATSIRSLEDRANHYSDRVVELETQLTSLSSRVKQLTSKAEDLESRQRRDNLRIIGLNCYKTHWVWTTPRHLTEPTEA